STEKPEKQLFIEHNQNRLVFFLLEDIDMVQKKKQKTSNCYSFLTETSLDDTNLTETSILIPLSTAQYENSEKNGNLAHS
ncbi:35298_t:CDS:1, partial [Gigaspora margarita]